MNYNFDEIIKKIKEMNFKKVIKNVLPRKYYKKLSIFMLLALLVFGGYRYNIYTSFKYKDMNFNKFNDINENLFVETEESRETFNGNLNNTYNNEDLSKIVKTLSKISKKSDTKIVQTTNQDNTKSFSRENDFAYLYIDEVCKNKYNIKYRIYLDLNELSADKEIYKKDLKEISQCLKAFGLSRIQSTTVVNMLVEGELINSLIPNVCGFNDGFIFNYDANEQTLTLYVK